MFDILLFEYLYNMRRIISGYVIQQLLLVFLISSVESLRGERMGVDIVDVGPRECPFIASLQDYNNAEPFCTGVLISARHVITAAHCLDETQADRVRVTIGSSNTLWTIATWIMYDDWANKRGILLDPKDWHDIAILTLSNVVIQINVPVIRLTDLNKKQVQGKKATAIGWEVRQIRTLKKASVNILSDEDCERNERLLTNFADGSRPNVLCATAQTYVLMEEGDSGAPLIDQFGSLLGIHFAAGPEAEYAWANFSEEIFNSYQQNLYLSISYYRQFITSVTRINNSQLNSI